MREIGMGRQHPFRWRQRPINEICREDLRHLTFIGGELRLPFRSECDRLGGAPSEHRINAADRLR
jgi:hypothetical protein